MGREAESRGEKTEEKRTKKWKMCNMPKICKITIQIMSLLRTVTKLSPRKMLPKNIRIKKEKKPPAPIANNCLRAAHLFVDYRS